MRQNNAFCRPCTLDETDYLGVFTFGSPFAPTVASSLSSRDHEMLSSIMREEFHALLNNHGIFRTTEWGFQEFPLALQKAEMLWLKSFQP